jgi:branched-chain amino acid transport system permease protein
MFQLLVAGLAAGGCYALIGCCVVLLYRTTGVLNFAQALFGAAGAYTTAVLYGDNWTLGAAVGVGVVVATTLASVVGVLLSTVFQELSEQVRATAMIAVTVGLLTAGLRVFGDTPLSVPSIVPSASVSLGRARVSGETGVLLVLCGLVVLGAGLFLRRTTTGVRLRALAERPVTAELLGVPVRRLSIGVWAVTGALSAVAMLLVAPARSDDFRTLSLLVLPGLAAALVGGFNSLGSTVVGGLVLGGVESASVQWPLVGDYKAVLPLALVAAALAWSQRKQVWDEAR